jgi:hypothetical protein
MWLDDEDAQRRHRRGQWVDKAAQSAEESGAETVVKTPGWVTPAYCLGGLMALVLALPAVMGDVNVAKAFIVVPVLGGITYAIAKRFAERAKQPAIVPILMGGFVVHLAGTMVRYWIGLQVYGTSDATEYAKWGRRLAPQIRQFQLPNVGKLRGTNFVRLVSGFVYALTPASTMVAYIVFGFMSFIGMIFFWRAYKRALPNHNDLRYLQVIMLFPSLAFWPSSIGKDSWMVMGVAIASYGVANILTNRTILGWAMFIVGVYAVLAVRPHVGICLLVGLVVAELFRKRGLEGAGRAGVSLIMLFFMGGIIMGSAASFLGIQSWNRASVQQELDSVGGRTSEGRSEFTPTQVNSPAQFPIAAFTVLFRPMPYETHSPQEMGTAAEDVALLIVVMISLPRLFAAFRRARQRPYLLYCFAAICVFIVEYSSFSNFALIARERTQVTALLLVFICMPRKEPVVVDDPRVRKSTVTRYAPAT